ncbi:Rossmann-like and DUF2520 domain-containing protein [Hymenobacter weizhouensis]|uniref:Rossmann-like and DUF2520 domain-containing protein n=1 Tax=Hymenobacter sp. YIM 151500-1 TaxID=2987689 RepID=UPI002227167A|nr:Rossmann-like and DUF2520 domain-containing protein [Hymenobacter sp. YIM 151500-1]UYZ61707.1 DUF2520 domain-containing protein [Hymenobacter sp. YIM 151500-1]
MATSALHSVVLLGAGRVAQHLGPALVAAGCSVRHVWSRTAASAAALARQLPGATAGTDLTQLPPADLYLLLVPDAAVPVVLAAARFPAGAVVAHTAGALPLAAVAAVPQVRAGVLYPLQTFSPGRTINWHAVPLCLEAADAATYGQLRELARRLSADVRPVDTAQRLRLHVAAVFACNFINHLLGIGHALATEAGLPFELLHPLVMETVSKALAAPPFTVQTGPALRHDAPTLARHQEALAAHPGWQHLYNELTRSIQHIASGPLPNNEAGAQL